jgi:hypothetical protein
VLAVLVGFATGTVDSHRGGEYILMAVHTAIGFIGMGAGILAFAWDDRRAETHSAPTWLPMLIGIGVLAATIHIWQVLEAQERASITRMIRSETASARSVRSELAAGLDAQIHVLQRIARCWENAGTPVKEDWEFEALLNMRDFRGYQAIAWIDPTYHVCWLVPLEGNEGLQDRPLLPSERPRRSDNAKALPNIPSLSP